MSVWFAVPSARPPAEAEPRLRLWRERGYRIALLRQGDPIACDLLEMTPTYLGWAASVNYLVKRILHEDPHAEWIVTGGDDYEPELQLNAEQIARQCRSYFINLQIEKGNTFDCVDHATFGVMQPTGDRWGDDGAGGYPKGSAYIDRICGSPWMGRSFCERIYGGNGPLWAEFHHMYSDQHLQCVAEKLGILWQRRDLTQFHDHWGRKPGAEFRDCPEFLLPVNSPKHWNESRAIFERLRAGGFSEAFDLLPVEGVSPKRS